MRQLADLAELKLRELSAACKGPRPPSSGSESEFYPSSSRALLDPEFANNLDIGQVKLESKTDVSEASKTAVQFLRSVNKTILREFYQKFFGTEITDSIHRHSNDLFQFKVTLLKNLTEDAAENLINAWAQVSKRVIQQLLKVNSLFDAKGNAEFLKCEKGDLAKLAFFGMLITNLFKYINEHVGNLQVLGELNSKSDSEFLEWFITQSPKLDKAQVSTVRSQKISLQYNSKGKSFADLLRQQSGKTSPTSVAASPRIKGAISPPLANNVEIMTFKKRVADLEAALGESETKLSTAQQERQALEAQLDQNAKQASDALNRIENEKSATEAELSILLSKYDGLSSENAGLRSEISALRPKIQQLEGELNTVKAKNTKYLGIYEAAGKKVEEYKEVNIQLRAELARLKVQRLEPSVASEQIVVVERPAELEPESPPKSSSKLLSLLSPKPKVTDGQTSAQQMQQAKIASLERQLENLEQIKNDEISTLTQKLVEKVVSGETIYERSTSELATSEILAKKLILEKKYKETADLYFHQQNFDDQSKFTPAEKAKILEGLSGKSLFDQFQAICFGELAVMYSNGKAQETLSHEQLSELLQKSWENTKKRFIDSPVQEIKSARKEALENAHSTETRADNKYTADLVKINEALKEQKIASSLMKENIEREFKTEASEAIQPLIKASKERVIRDEEIQTTFSLAQKRTADRVLVPLILDGSWHISTSLLARSVNPRVLQARVAGREMEAVDFAQPAAVLAEAPAQAAADLAQAVDDLDEVLNPAQPAVAPPLEPLPNGIPEDFRYVFDLVNTRGQLHDIRKLMSLATNHYIDHNMYGSISSLIHHHGETGKTRAEVDHAEFTAIFNLTLRNLDTEVAKKLGLEFNADGSVKKGQIDDFSEDLIRQKSTEVIEKALNDFFVQRIEGSKEDVGNHYLHSLRTYHSLVLREFQEMKKDPARRLDNISHFSEFKGYQDLVNATEGAWYWNKKKISAHHLVETLKGTGLFGDGKKDLALDKKLERDNNAFAELQKS